MEAGKLLIEDALVAPWSTQKDIGEIEKSDSGVAESVEMGVETFRVEWGKPPELEKSYGRWPKSVEDDLWPLEDNHFDASFCFTERSLLLDYMKKILWCNTIFVSWPFFWFILLESET